MKYGIINRDEPANQRTKDAACGIRTLHLRSCVLLVRMEVLGKV
jgi:hypothetical protein